MPRYAPNLLTILRLGLAVVLFILLGLLAEGKVSEGSTGLLFNVSLAIFSLAVVTDFLDGQIARRWGLQTDFGRILDPFADKVIVCGAFVQLIPIEGSLVSSWMVVVILARELLVDGLRGFAESRGVAFPSMFSGKLKMTLQSACIIWLLGMLANFPEAAWAQWGGLALIYATVVTTVVSGGVYVLHARNVLGGDTVHAAEVTGGPTTSQVAAERPA